MSPTQTQQHPALAISGLPVNYRLTSKQEKQKWKYKEKRNCFLFINRKSIEKKSSILNHLRILIEVSRPQNVCQWSSNISFETKIDLHTYIEQKKDKWSKPLQLVNRYSGVSKVALVFPQNWTWACVTQPFFVYQWSFTPGLCQKVMPG